MSILARCMIKLTEAALEAAQQVIMNSRRLCCLLLLLLGVPEHIKGVVVARVMCRRGPI